MGEGDSGRLADLVQDERAEEPFRRLDDETVTEMLNELMEKMIRVAETGSLD